MVDPVVMVRGQATLRPGETKSRGSRRVVALDSRTVAVMKGHKSRQNAEKLVGGPAYEDRDLVFSNELGALVSPAWFTRATKRHAVAAKIPALSPHAAARHTWATLALEAGIHAKVVQDDSGTVRSRSLLIATATSSRAWIVRRLRRWRRWFGEMVAIGLQCSTNPNEGSNLSNLETPAVAGVSVRVGGGT